MLEKPQNLDSFQPQVFKMDNTIISKTIIINHSITKLNKQFDSCDNVNFNTFETKLNEAEN